METKYVAHKFKILGCFLTVEFVCTHQRVNCTEISLLLRSHDKFPLKDTRGIV